MTTLVTTNEGGTVLVVDESDTHLAPLDASLKAAGYRVVVAQDGTSALRQLAAQVCQLVLCAFRLPDMDGLDLCRAIKSAPGTRGIPVIMLGDENDEVQRERALQAGADDYAVKPVEKGMVVGLVNAQLRIGRLNRQLQELEGVIVSLARAADGRDQWMAGMSERVAHWSMRLGAALGLAEDELTLLYKAALLHDVGTLSVPAAILAKPGSLDADEFRQVKQHPVVGEQLLMALPDADRLLPAIRHHHERVDGRGYPDGLSGTEIPLFARVIAIADTFAALTMARPYRPRLAKADAVRALQAGAGTQWDVDLIERFLQVLDDSATEASAREIRAG
ncbi:MAG: response regulator [Candidatus Dormibacteraeota bacterium]|nr:response regulator [Candidatus Dormibacteraeota bacterium]